MQPSLHQSPRSGPILLLFLFFLDLVLLIFLSLDPLPSSLLLTPTLTSLLYSLCLLILTRLLCTLSFGWFHRSPSTPLILDRLTWDWRLDVPHPSKVLNILATALGVPFPLDGSGAPSSTFSLFPRSPLILIWGKVWHIHVYLMGEHMGLA